MALKKGWWVKPWLAIFGPVLIPMAFFMGIIMFLFPEAKPDIDYLPNMREKPITSMWYLAVATTAMTAEPGLFMLTQIATWGQSDLRDFAIIYMSSEEAMIYMMLVTAWLTIDWLPSVAWMAMFWWVYGIQVCLKFIFALFKGGDKDGKRGRRRGSGYRGDGDG